MPKKFILFNDQGRRQHKKEFFWILGLCALSLFLILGALCSSWILSEKISSSKNIISQKSSSAPSVSFWTPAASLDDLKQNARPKVLVFYASWCGECEQTLLNVEKINSEAVKNKNYQIVAVHLGNTESARRGQETLEQDNLANITLLEDKTGELFKTYAQEKRTLPLVVILDADGKMLTREQGVLSLEDLHQMLARN